MKDNLSLSITFNVGARLSTYYSLSDVVDLVEQRLETHGTLAELHTDGGGVLFNVSCVM